MTPKDYNLQNRSIIPLDAMHPSPESSAAGYQTQSFVSARDEGNSRNEATWLHRVQLSSCRWSNS
jgi:hypothetical protein